MITKVKEARLEIEFRLKKSDDIEFIDKNIERIANRYHGYIGGSGMGFGYRDVTIYFSNQSKKTKADALVRLSNAFDEIEIFCDINKLKLTNGVYMTLIDYKGNMFLNSEIQRL